MIKKISMLFFVFIVLAGVAQAFDLEEKTVLDGKVSLLTPTEFGPMSAEMLSLKYPSERRPTVVLSNASGTVNLTFNHTTSKVPDDAQVIQQALTGAFHKLYAGAQWLQDGVEEVNGHKFAVFELITPAVDTKIHNIIYATTLNGTMLLISFNTTLEDAPRWLEAGKKMMASVKLH